MRRIAMWLSIEEWTVLRHTGTVIILFGVFLLCFIWSGLSYMVHNEREKEIDNTVKETANLARVFEEHTLRTIKSVDQTVLFLKYEYERVGQGIDIPRYIREGRIEIQPFVLLSIADETGDLKASSQVPFVFSNLKDREHFLVHKDAAPERLFISKPVLGRSSGKPSIQMSRRINKPDGSFGGAAVVSVDPFYFIDFYKEVDLGKNSSITLVGDDGVIRARQSGMTAEVGQVLIASKLQEMQVGNDAGHYRAKSPVDGVQRIYSYRAVSGYPLTVLVGMDEEEVLTQVNERVAEYYRVAWVVTVVILLFIAVLLGVTTRQRRDAAALRQARDTLESTVEQRTQELFAANQELTAMNEEHIAMNEELQHANQELKTEVVERKRTGEQLTQKNQELADAYGELKNAQAQVIHQEKMASIGQLAAGVAHEINNPLGFVMSNFETLEKYVAKIAEMITAFRRMHHHVIEERVPALQDEAEELLVLEKQKKLDYLLEDLRPLFGETHDGLNRVGDIVKALRVFSRVDQLGRFEDYDLNEGIQTSLIVSRNEVKYVAKVEEHLSKVPVIKAIGGQINQVVLNILLNAAYAVKAKGLDSLGLITVSTYADDRFVYCSIKDTGGGIPEKIRKDIFNPFFTTKPVGKGTGLGLSISYDIIVNKHHGDISFVSEDGVGTTFVIKLPLQQPDDKPTEQ
ncbi:MAG: ATP-binding protein [Negativicutes bacterium]|nr:ATP-binding protein [Negativicutes bacterium]